MTKYESKKNPGTFLTTDGVVDEKTKTMAVTMDDGKEKRISVSTLKRWWKKVEELETDQEEEAKVEEEQAGNADQPEVVKPEESETEQAETEEPRAEQAETEEPGAEQAETEEPGAEQAETKETETEQVETKEPRAEQVETKESETEQAETEEPEVVPEQKTELETEEVTQITKDGVTECHKAAKMLEDIFNTINYIYFEDSLPKSAILVQNTPREYARHTMQKIDKTADNSEFTYEISIGAKFMDKPVEGLAALLFHEMTHIYCAENTITDTCQNGRYHNGKFKKQCEDRGLLVEYDLANGYAYVLPSEDFVKALKDSGIDMATKFPHIELTKKSRGRAGRKMFVYECPHCGQHFKAAEELNIKCGKCNVIMECS